MPISDRNSTITVEPGQNVELHAFSPEALFERSGNDLVVSENGAQVTYQGFFAQGAGKPLPDLVMADGTVVKGGEFLRAQNGEMDLSTAAGPDSGSASSGVGTYSDDAGSLLGGVDALGMQEGVYWSAASASRFEYVGDAPITETPADPAVPHSRLVMTSASHRPFVINLMDAQGNPVSAADSVLVTFADGTPAGAGYFNFSYNPATGELTLTLTPAGQAALQNRADFSDKLVVTVNGSAYDILLEGAPNGFTSPDGEGSGLQNEWVVSYGAVIDANISMGDSLFGSKVVIDSTEEVSYGTHFDNGSLEDLDATAHTGLQNSSIIGRGNTEVSIRASNEVPGDDLSARKAYGIFMGKEGNILVSDPVTQHQIKAGSVEVEAYTSDAYGSDNPYPHTGTSHGNLHVQESIGILNKDKSVLNISANEISVKAIADGRAAGSTDSTVISATAIQSGWTHNEYSSQQQGTPNIPSSGQSKLTLQGSDIEIKAEVDVRNYETAGSTNLSATGLDARPGSVDLIGTDGDDVFTIGSSIYTYYQVGGWSNGDNYEATGLSASCYGNNGELESDRAKVNIEGGTGNDTLNIFSEVKLEGTAVHDGHSSGSVHGVIARGSDININNFESVNIRAASNGRENHGGGFSEYAVMATGNSKMNITNANSMNVDISSTGHGVYLAGNSAFNVRSGGDMNMKLSSFGDALHTTEYMTGETSRTSIHADGRLTLNINSGYDPQLTSMGIVTNASDGVAETIITANGGMNLDISAGYMAIDTSGNSNARLHIESYGDHEDLITITGQISASAGRNEIFTNEGDDRLSIAGDLTTIYGGVNDIRMGDGADRLEISGGRITSEGGINRIDMGSGADTLEITADLQAFNAPFTSSPGSIQIDMGSGDDLLVLKGSTLTATGGSSITLDGGAGFDVLEYHYSDMAALQSLADASSGISNFEKLVLDFGDGSSDSLDLDSLMAGLGGVVDNLSGSEIWIKGDAADSLNVTGAGWTEQVGSQQVVDNVTYYQYEHADTQATIWIQAGLLD